MNCLSAAWLENGVEVLHPPCSLVRFEASSLRYTLAITIVWRFIDTLNLAPKTHAGACDRPLAPLSELLSFTQSPRPVCRRRPSSKKKEYWLVLASDQDTSVESMKWRAGDVGQSYFIGDFRWCSEFGFVRKCCSLLYKHPPYTSPWLIGWLTWAFFLCSESNVSFWFITLNVVMERMNSRLWTLASPTKTHNQFKRGGLPVPVGHGANTSSYIEITYVLDVRTPWRSTSIGYLDDTDL